MYCSESLGMGGFQNWWYHQIFLVQFTFLCITSHSGHMDSCQCPFAFALSAKLTRTCAAPFGLKGLGEQRSEQGCSSSLR